MEYLENCQCSSCRKIRGEKPLNVEELLTLSFESCHELYSLYHKDYKVNIDESTKQKIIEMNAIEKKLENFINRLLRKT